MTEEQRAPNLLRATLVLGVVLWMFTTTGGQQVFVNEVLSEAYDSQAEHFLRGDVGVDDEAIRHEALVVGDATRMYFGPFPALLRIPLNIIYPGGRGYWSRISGFCAGMIALTAFAGILRIALCVSPLSSRWKTVLANACLIGFGLGSPLLLLLGNLSIYDEAIVWGLGWAIAALYFALRCRTAEGVVLTWCLVGFSLSAGAALLSRATFGAPLLLITPLLAPRLFHRNPIRNFAALFLPIGAALLFYLFLTYAKFGDLNGMPMRYSTNPEQQEFAVKHGLFRLERVPYSFADYFFLRRPEFQRDPPFVNSDRQWYDHPTLFVMRFTETYSSLVWCSSWVLLGSAIGVAILLRPRDSEWVDRSIAAIFLLQCVLILCFMGLAQRYLAEFFPFLIFTFVFFLRSSRAAFQLRYVLVTLVAVSVLINSLATVCWLVDADLNVPKETRAKWEEFLGRPSKLPSRL
ncbi:MAG TPA: hypothetical protein VH227_04495 [Candidatus Udaeobacter sp.]|jgi:hypothetical protein|nr:hypothetical protein [Candidatus Udaeobacter sp.]